MEAQAEEVRRGPKRNPATRDNLVSVGVRMFHESGYTATGIKEIVDAAEVPKGSFYNHFQSKEAFGKEVVDAYFNRALVELRPLLEDGGIPPLQRLRLYFDEMTRSFQQAGYVRGCLMGNLSLEVADHSASIRETLAAHFQTWSALFEACIAEAQETGAIAGPQSPSVLAQFLLNSWEGALLRMRAENSDKPLREFTEVVFGSLLVDHDFKQPVKNGQETTVSR
ncbi:TetR family transcriptional regulator [Rhizobium leguminosarum]|uniref:TetR/AcrR family transcriptional regulator n=1 Tax=Rhizobium leguminosarum TaxID=384 RepID=UPI001C919A80|nr:TetR/AcrR family transcriptional regulator [Rhizobium leguminosarum]MBY2924368.1 TetR family transcriptional regulator [Rhizobium leguminosarum]